MTLLQLVSRRLKRPQRGDSVIARVRGEALNHMVVIAMCRNIVYDKKPTREFAFLLACGRSDVRANELVVRFRESITCIHCAARRSEDLWDSIKAFPSL